MAKRKKAVSVAEENPPIRYRIIGSVILDLQILNRGLTGQIISEFADKFDYNTNVRLGVRENKLVEVILTFSVTIDPTVFGQKGDPIVVIGMTPITTFEIAGVEHHIGPDGQVVLTKDVMFGMVNVAIGTFRGIFWSKISGTLYETLYMPLIPYDQIAAMIETFEKVVQKKDDLKTPPPDSTIPAG